MDSLNTSDFQENLLRLYLGKYESRFRPVKNRHGGIVMLTEPHPQLAVQLNYAWVSLAELIDIEEEDPFYGAFDHYQIDIIMVPVEDPEGVKKVEKAIAKAFLSGTQS